MSAFQALKAAREAGVRIGMDGDALTLDADAAPPAAVLDLLSRHKAGVVALLRIGSDGWSGEDWQTLFEERGGNRRVRWRAAARVRRGPRLRLLHGRMAQPQSGALAARTLPWLRWKRTCPRQAAAVRHRTARPCLAAFALLVRLAGKPESRSDRRPFDLWNLHEDIAMSAKKPAAIAARASRRSRSSTSTSMRAGRQWSAWSPRLPARERGGGDRSDLEEQPHAKQIAHAPEPALPCPDAGREAVPVARDGERALPDARRQGAGCAEGQ